MGREMRFFIRTWTSAAPLDRSASSPRDRYSGACAGSMFERRAAAPSDHLNQRQAVESGSEIGMERFKNSIERLSKFGLMISMH
jgi:hypothetical protein